MYNTNALVDKSMILKLKIKKKDKYNYFKEIDEFLFLKNDKKNKMLNKNKNYISNDTDNFY